MEFENKDVDYCIALNWIEGLLERKACKMKSLYWEKMKQNDKKYYLILLILLNIIESMPDCGIIIPPQCV